MTSNKHPLRFLVRMKRFKELWHTTEFQFLLSIFLRDSLVWLSLGIVVLFTFETLLPGFITARFNLALPLLLHASIFLASLSVKQRAPIPDTRLSSPRPVLPRFTRFVLILSGLWFLIILFISLLKYSLPMKLFIVTMTAFILTLLWKEYLVPHRES